MAATLEDKFEVLKEIGDGSCGSVVLARVRTAGSQVARRGTMVRTHMLSTASIQNSLADGCAGCDQNHEKDI
jgi:hypothetical protein